MSALELNSILFDTNNNGDITPSTSGELWFNDVLNRLRVQTSGTTESLAYLSDLGSVNPVFQEIYNNEATINAAFTLAAGGSFIINDQDNTLFELNDGGSVSLVPGIDGGNVFIGSAGTSGNLTVYGNLTVLGDTIQGASETVIFGDNTLLLNSGEVGAGVTVGTSGLEIERGTSTNSFLLWDESASSLVTDETGLGATGRWTVDQGDGTNRTIATEGWTSQNFIDINEISFISGDILNDIQNATLATKAGSVSTASFTGNPKVANITLGTAFSNANYTVSVISDENRSWSIDNQLAGSFTINSNANRPLDVGTVYWIAVEHGETT